MVGKGFKVFSMIFAVLGFALAVFSILVAAYAANGTGIPNIDNLLKGVVAQSFVYIAGGLTACFTNLFSFILVVRGEKREVIRRWYFIPALIGSLISIATVVGIVYFIIVLVALFKSKVTPYEEDEAKRYVIVTSIIFISIGLVGLILPLVFTFDPALMSLLMFFGMCLTSFSLSAGMYFICGPHSRFNILIKIATLLAELAVLVGLYFLFVAILKNNVERFDGDWPTIHTAIVTAVSVAGLIEVSYFVFGLANKHYDAYVNMQQSAIAIALVGVIVANFVVMFWWLIIEAILWLISFIFILGFIGLCSGGSGGGGGGGGSGGGGSSRSGPPSYKEEREIKTESGRTVTVTYEGNGNYTDSDGGHWHSNDHEKFTKD